jgi:hypothetical protein
MDRHRPDPPVDQDSRFPSGPWTGYFLQRSLPGRQWMELQLTFNNGRIRGDGRDRIGAFTFTGRYDLGDGRCRWTKRYVGRHDVAYSGYNEGKGIWGVWEIPPSDRGGFHIWPVGMGDPTVQAEDEEVKELDYVPREIAVPARRGAS